MIEDHPRIGFAVLAGVLVALVLLVALLVSGGSGAEPAGLGTGYATASVAPEAVAPEQISRASDGRRAAGVDPAWASRTGAKVGVPTTAMLAYGNAELVLRKENRGCHLAWNTLAGIGWIESQHGTLDDRALNADGTSSPPVIGPALDGDGFAAIRSTPSSAAWHGDATWEHAVGPMQFIASSWERWGTDGDGDGTADPLDLDDAALATARYLCADAHDLATTSGWNAAVHSFNHDQAYVVQVANAANTYAQRTR